MESQREQTQETKKKFALFEHPWLSLLAFMVTSVFAIALAGSVIFGWIGVPDQSSFGQFIQPMTFHVLTCFILVPFILRLPQGKRSFRQYLGDIGLSNLQPFIKLVLLGLSCAVILSLSQAAGSLVFRLFQGKPINGYFLRQVFDLSGDLPPRFNNLLISFPSIFEEVAFRGIVLTVFLRKYPVWKAIIFSSLGFGLMHLLNLTNGSELVWGLGQVIWAFILGLAYGYIFVKTHSLLPPMILHYLGNVFVGSLNAYLQTRASIEMQALYGVIFTFGIVPTTLIILWTRYFVTKWLPGKNVKSIFRFSYTGQKEAFL